MSIFHSTFYFQKCQNVELPNNEATLNRFCILGLSNSWKHFVNIVHAANCELFVYFVWQYFCQHLPRLKKEPIIDENISICTRILRLFFNIYYQNQSTCVRVFFSNLECLKFLLYVLPVFDKTLSCIMMYGCRRYGHGEVYMLNKSGTISLTQSCIRFYT